MARGCAREATSRPDAATAAAIPITKAESVVKPFTPSPPATRAPQAKVVFVDATDEVGLDFYHFTGATGEYYFSEWLGPGCALFDYDNDGDLDLYAVQGAFVEPGVSVDQAVFRPRCPWPPRNRLYRNELIGENSSGAVRFTDVTVESGAGHLGPGVGCTAGDYDNDGDLDLYVTNFGPNALLRNNGDGTFTDVTEPAGVGNDAWGTSTAFVDYDHDGNLDLFVVNYVDFTLDNNQNCYSPAGARDYCGPKAYNPVGDVLYHNEGDGTFRDVTVASGVSAAYGRGLGVVCFDADRDGWIDIYVANDADANQLWHNRQDGTFADVALICGAAYNAFGAPEAGMGVTAGDFDHDGDDDVFLAHLYRETNTLYVNNGEGVFQDATTHLKLCVPSWLSTGFGTKWFDYDNDGDLDLYVSNGAVAIHSERPPGPYPYDEHNQLFRNDDGERFVEMPWNEAMPSESSEVGRGAAFGDVDNDGDIDIVLANNNGRLRFMRNVVGQERHYLTLQLQGGRGNRDALGARVAMSRKGWPVHWQRVAIDGSYCSGNDRRVHFGLGDAPAAPSITVYWPNGSVETWTDVPADTQTLLVQGEGRTAG